MQHGREYSQSLSRNSSWPPPILRTIRKNKNRGFGDLTGVLEKSAYWVSIELMGIELPTALGGKLFCSKAFRVFQGEWFEFVKWRWMTQEQLHSDLRQFQWGKKFIEIFTEFASRLGQALKKARGKLFQGNFFEALFIFFFHQSSAGRKKWACLQFEALELEKQQQQQLWP